MPAHYPGFQRLTEVVRQLRDPETGCPWDLKQTHESLRPYMLEEAYELIDAIDSSDNDHIREELGDVLLQVMLHSQLADDAGLYNIDAVAEGIADKLVRRHPHVFGDVSMDSADAVTANWQQIKAVEKAAKGAVEDTSIMADLPKGTPALSKALEVSRRAVRQGFEWPDFESLWACVLSEHDEFRRERDADAPEGYKQDRLEDELGDILFATVNLARFHKIDPEVALNRATNKFIRRYRAMEGISEAPLDTLNFEALDDLWNRAKAQTAATAQG